MSMDVNWESFHDATLIQISVEWPEGRCEMTFALSVAPTSSASIQAIDLRKLVVPREAPWGMSVSVNRIYLRSHADGETSTLTIEMQSGDTILMEARSIMVSPRRSG